MSGIAGIIDLNLNKIEQNNCEILREYISYRAFDGMQEFSDKNIFLLYTKLSVTEQCDIDEQPLHDKQHNLLIVSNSRIDNRDELLKILGIKKSSTDCELILSAYIKWKQNVCDYLIGPFSFVIYDYKNNLIFSAVDHFAQKPLYFSYIKGKFIFSTDPKSISMIDQDLYDLNIDKVLDYLVFQGSVNNDSFFNKIKKINKGQYIKIDQKNLTIERYYALPKINKSSKTGCSEGVKKLFIKVINSQCRSNNNMISTTCSGGLDSTSIASVLNNENSGKNIFSFSVHFNNLEKEDFSKTDERFYVEKYKEKFNANHVFLTSYKTPLGYLDDQLVHAFSPPKSGNGYMHQEIIDGMKKVDSRVLYDGFDGDSVISHGAEYLIELGMEFKLKKLLKETKMACKLNGRKFSAYHTLKNYFFKPLIPFNLRLLFNRVPRSGVTEEKKYQYLSNKAKKRIDFIKRFKQYYPDSSYKYRKSLESHRNGLSLPFWEEELEIIDFISAINGIEMRLPFMDKRLVEFCLQVPGYEKFKKGVTRAYFREAMKGIAPKEVLNKHTKANLGPVIMNEIKDNYKEMLSTIKKSNANLSALFTEKLINDLLQKRFSELTKLEKVNIYKWYTLERWLDKNNYKIKI